MDAPDRLRLAINPDTRDPLADAGTGRRCGGVGAGYLWFLRHSRLRGRLLLIDDDIIAWHNLNRLSLRDIAGRRRQRKPEGRIGKGLYLGDSWNVEVVPKEG